MDGFIKIKFFYWHEGVEAESIENMWTIPEDGYYKIDNIPFYVKGFALGDIVSAKEENGELYIDQLIKESGNSTIHLVFFDETIAQRTREELKTMGCISEISDKPFLISINVPAEISYMNMIKPYLDEGCKKELWDYGEACLATNQE